jgi:hypothetical protein
MKTLNTLGKGLGILTVSFAMLSLLAGKSASHSIAYARAAAHQAFARLSGALPVEVRDKTLDQALRQARSDIIDWRVKLILSTRKLEQLRAERDKLASRVARDRQVLAEAYPVLAAAIRDGQSIVRFAGSVIPLSDFQREIDGLLSRRARDTEALAVTEQGLTRLEDQHKQAEQALVASERALERAEHEIAILKERRDHAAIVARTTELVAAISANLSGPHAEIAEGIDELREEVIASEARNEAMRAIASADLQPAGEMLSGEHARLGALQAIYDDVQAQKRAQGLTARDGATDPAQVAADRAPFGCDR